MGQGSKILIVLTVMFVLSAVLFAALLQLLPNEIIISKGSHPTISTSAPVSSKLNINIATEAELSSLPGIGSHLAQAIIEYRNANGPFASIEDLCHVSGIGPKKLEAIADLITVGG